MNILVVEDEVKVSAFIKQGLEESGYNVEVAFDGLSALELAPKHDFDVILMDVIMPGMNGFEVVKKLRKELNIFVPVIMLSALDQSENIIEGLDSGADDYLTKPFKFGELLARLRVVGRRKENVDTPNLLKVADIEMNLDTKIVTRSGKEITLTAKEFILLEFFMKNKDKVLDRVEILENVWDINFDAGTNVVKSSAQYDGSFITTNEKS